MRNTASILSSRVAPGRSESCRFCRIATGQSSVATDRPFLECATHVAIPSLGSLVPGWTLLVPRTHVLNSSNHYGNQELSVWRAGVAQLLGKTFDRRVRMFEHGAVNSRSPTGCGVDHAHLHLVPLDVDIRETFKELGPTLNWETVESKFVASYTNRREYLLYCDDATALNPVCCVAILRRPTSQFFRRAVASAIGKPSAYDYRHHPELHNVLETQKAMTRYARSNHGRAQISSR